MTKATTRKRFRKSWNPFVVTVCSITTVTVQHNSNSKVIRGIHTFVYIFIKSNFTIPFVQKNQRPGLGPCVLKWCMSLVASLNDSMTLRWWLFCVDCDYIILCSLGHIVIYTDCIVYRVRGIHICGTSNSTLNYSQSNPPAPTCSSSLHFYVIFHMYCECHLCYGWMLVTTWSTTRCIKPEGHNRQLSLCSTGQASVSGRELLLHAGTVWV